MEAEPAEVEKVKVVVLEPDHWRYRGLCCVLEEGGSVEVLGELDFASILTLSVKPPELNPEVILLSHRLIVEYGIALVAQLKNVFSCPVLVHGEEDSIEVTAQILAAGGAGYFLLTSPPAYLFNAVAVTKKKKLWGSREAIQRMAEKLMEGEVDEHGTARLSEGELILLRLLNEGLSNKEIAKRVGVAEVTIKSRLTKLYKRFGVTTRLQLLSAAFRHGLLISPASGNSERMERPVT